MSTKIDFFSSLLELNANGSKAVIDLPRDVGRVLTIAAWTDGTYIVSPHCAPFLGAHISRAGLALSRFGSSDCRLPPSGVVFATHSSLYSIPSRRKLYTVDAKEGQIRIWQPDFRLTKTVILPTHPRHDEIVASMRRRPDSALIVLNLFGFPVLSTDGLLVFPGNRRGEELEKVPFAFDTASETLRSFATVKGKGSQIIVQGKDGMLIDVAQGGELSCYYFGL